MRISMDVDVDIKARGMRGKAEDDPRFWRFAATQWHRLYSPYVPMRTGMLKDSVRIGPKEIKHTQPYAHRMYEGTHFNFRKDLNPKATAHWDQAAAGTQMRKLVSALQAYIDSGRLKMK